MSFFNKGFSFSPVRSFFNKTAGGARSLFNKTPGAFRAISGGLGAASRAVGAAAREGDKLLSDPAVNKLAQQAGSASRATNPSTYAGQSPAAAASSAIEKAKSLGGQAKNLFV